MAYTVVTLSFSRRLLTVEIAFLPLLLKRPLPFCFILDSFEANSGLHILLRFV